MSSMVWDAWESGITTSFGGGYVGDTYYENEGNCPRCGKGNLVKRVSKKGENIGNIFLGCSRFPQCRYSENIDTNQ